MTPTAYVASSILSVAGMGLGMVGMFESSPLLTGVGFASTVSLQLWTMGKIGPINVRLAVLEERIGRIEEDLAPNRRRQQRHSTPPVE